MQSAAAAAALVGRIGAADGDIADGSMLQCDGSIGPAGGLRCGGGGGGGGAAGLSGNGAAAGTSLGMLGLSDDSSDSENSDSEDDERECTYVMHNYLAKSRNQFHYPKMINSSKDSTVNWLACQYECDVVEARDRAQGHRL